MFLTENASNLILTDLDLRMDVVKELRKSEDWIRRIANRNEYNNDLTKYSVLLIIQKKSGMELSAIVTREQPVHQLTE